MDLYWLSVGAKGCKAQCARLTLPYEKCNQILAIQNETVNLKSIEQKLVNPSINTFKKTDAA